jgi:hypothetical protein
MAADNPVMQNQDVIQGAHGIHRSPAQLAALMHAPDCRHGGRPTRRTAQIDRVRKPRHAISLS